MRGCVNDACWTNLPHFRLAYLQQKKGWLEWVDWAALISKRMAMISYDSLWLHFHQKRFLGLSVCVHDRVRIESRFQSPIFNALGVQLPKREAKILRAALFQQVWQFQQIAPSSVFRAVLDGRRTCKSPRASTHESSDVMCWQYQYTSHTVLNCVGGTVAIA